MFDFDLATIYEVQTKRLKEQVRRNSERFPEDFMFELTKNEWNELVANCDQLPKSIKYSSAPPFAFTQEGVAMLSGILRSPIAVKVNIGIMRAFVAVRLLTITPPSDRIDKLEDQMKELKQYIEEVFADYNDINEETRMQIELLNETFSELQSRNRVQNKPRKPVGYIKPTEI